MERRRWQSASRGGKAPLKRRRSSPVPGAAGSRAGGSQPCRRRLFGSADARGGPERGRLKTAFSAKTLAKINENIELSQVSHSCNQSNQVNVKETIDLGKKEEKTEENTVQLKESLIIHTESKENVEVSSSDYNGTGMTLPTGVSTFLLECLDADSTADYNTDASSSLSSCPTPETFRDDESERSNCYPEDSGKYKNSTLLDSSKAVAIDKITFTSNLSAILEPVLGNHQEQHTRRNSPSNYSYTFSALSVSTTLAGKKVCKITAARERTPDPKMSMSWSSPLGPERKPENQTAKSERLKPKKKGKNSNTLQEGTLSVSQLDAPGNTSARSVGLAARGLLVEEADAVGALCDTPEICSIVRMSPRQRSPRLHQAPVDRRAFWLAQGVPEDNITSTKNWIYYKHR